MNLLTVMKKLARIAPVTWECPPSCDFLDMNPSGYLMVAEMYFNAGLNSIETGLLIGSTGTCGSIYLHPFVQRMGGTFMESPKVE
jgi:hypothetical protein